MTIDVVQDLGSTIQYVATLGQTVFPVPFPFVNNTDIVVYRATVKLANGTDYVVSGAGNDTGGSLTLTVGAAANAIYTVTRDIAVNRLTQYQQNGPFTSAAINAELDNIVMIEQQLEDRIGRAIRVPVTATASSAGLELNPAAFAGAYLTMDANGNILPAVLSATAITGAIVGGLLFPPILAEANAGLTVNTGYKYGDLRRYGVVTNSSGAAAANGIALKALFNPAIANGPTGRFYCENTTGADVYSVGFPTGGCIPVRDGCEIDGQGCTLNLSGTGVASDSNSGFFFALRDFSFHGFTVNNTWATGPSTSAGNIVQIGARSNDSARWPIAVYDSLLSVPQGKCYVGNLRVNMNITGANVSSASGIALCGGIRGLTIENIFVNGNGTLPAFITQEFGWATNEAQPSARQSSHMRDFNIRNIEGANMDTVANTSGLIVLAGAYQGTIENIVANGVSNAVISSTGESMFYRPQAGVDDIAGKRSITIRNVTFNGVTNAGLNLSGSQPRATTVATGYLQRIWAASTAYGIRETVCLGGNMYVATVGGTSASSGGPTGTGSGIVDGTVTWNYVPLTVNTDQIDYIVENVSGTGTSAAAGILSSAGYLSVKGSCNFSGMANSIFMFAECTRFDIEGVRGFGAQNAGFEMAVTTGQIWPVVRLKKGTIRDCHVYGNSVASAGASGGIHLDNCSGVIVENNRLNSDVNYNGVAEATQGCGVQIGTNAFGVKADSNHVGNIVGGGNFAYFSGASAGNMNGNDIVNPLGVITQSGPWNVNGVGDATTTQLGNKTSNINTFGKMFKRQCFNDSNSRMLFALGPLNTDNWAYCDGNAPTTITPS